MHDQPSRIPVAPSVVCLHSSRFTQTFNLTMFLFFRNVCVAVDGEQELNSDIQYEHVQGDCSTSPAPS